MQKDRSSDSKFIFFNLKYVSVSIKKIQCLESIGFLWAINPLFELRTIKWFTNPVDFAKDILGICHPYDIVLEQYNTYQQTQSFS